MKAITILFLTFGLCQGYVSSPHLARFLPDENTKQCQGPEGAGLEPILVGLEKFAPSRKIFGHILAALTSDQEVKNIITYLTTPESLERFNRFFKSYEVGEIINFACKDLYFDAMFHIKQVGYILGLPTLEDNSMRTQRNAFNLRQGGVRGLVANILRVVDMENVKVYLQDKIDNDEYVQLIYKGLNTPEGWEVYEKMMDNEDIHKMLGDVAQLIADLPGVLVDLDKLFEWVELFYA